MEATGALLSGRMQAATIETTLRYQMEALKFLETRLDNYLHFLEGCQSPDYADDPFDSWCHFWQDAVLGYFREGMRIAEIGSTIMRKTAMRRHEDEKPLVENMAAQAAILGAGGCADGQM
ncbi:hypothetical protein [Ensifer sp. B1-9]|uniref:hypothetical protein n=1 Tax=Ensifer sp. B1-9 TaxID=3141455 RepID=UPI003D1978A2